jgi:hypothetical protein
VNSNFGSKRTGSSLFSSLPLLLRRASISRFLRVSGAASGAFNGLKKKAAPFIPSVMRASCWQNASRGSTSTSRSDETRPNFLKKFGGGGSWDRGRRTTDTDGRASSNGEAGSSQSGAPPSPRTPSLFARNLPPPPAKPLLASEGPQITSEARLWCWMTPRAFGVSLFDSIMAPARPEEGLVTRVQSDCR